MICEILHALDVCQYARADAQTVFVPCRIIAYAIPDTEKKPASRVDSVVYRKNERSSCQVDEAN